jgi:transposase-like protein
MLHCPRCTNQLEESIVIVDAWHSLMRWRCVKCRELYDISQLKEALASP